MSEEKKHEAFVDWKICLHCGQKSGHGVLRLFELPLGPLAPSDDMPIKGYVWIVNVTEYPERFHIEGTMNAPPPGSVRELFRLGAALGRKHLTWDRVDPKTGVVRPVTIRLPSVPQNDSSAAPGDGLRSSPAARQTEYSGDRKLRDVAQLSYLKIVRAAKWARSQIAKFANLLK